MVNELRHLIFSIIFCFCTQQVAAQALPHTRIGEFVRVGNTIEIAVNADKPFYVGNNIFVLVIGSQQFDLCRQTQEKSTGTLVFLVPIDRYNKLADGDKIYLTYGALLGEELQNKELVEACAAVPDACHYLGAYHTSMLSK